jgi:ATP synthase F1 delta subunit
MAFVRKSVQLAIAKPTTFSRVQSVKNVRNASTINPESLLKKFNPERKSDVFQKPALRLHSDSGAYAHALFAAAAEENAVDRVEKDLTQIRSLTSEEKVANAFSNKSSHFPRAQFLEEITKKVNASPLTKKYLNFLSTQNSLELTSDVAKDFARLAKSHRNEVDGVIITAKPISSDALNKARAKLEQRIPKGQKLSLTAEVNPDILGGTVIKLGDTTLDYSYKSEIDELLKGLEANIKTHFDNLANKQPRVEYEEVKPLTDAERAAKTPYLEKKYGH